MTILALSQSRVKLQSQHILVNMNTLQFTSLHLNRGGIDVVFWPILNPPTHKHPPVGTRHQVQTGMRLL